MPLLQFGVPSGAALAGPALGGAAWHKACILVAECISSCQVDVADSGCAPIRNGDAPVAVSSACAAAAGQRLQRLLKFLRMSFAEMSLPTTFSHGHCSDQYRGTALPATRKGLDVLEDLLERLLSSSWHSCNKPLHCCRPSLAIECTWLTPAGVVRVALLVLAPRCWSAGGGASGCCCACCAAVGGSWGDGVGGGWGVGGGAVCTGRDMLAPCADAAVQRLRCFLKFSSRRCGETLLMTTFSHVRHCCRQGCCIGLPATNKRCDFWKDQLDQ